jgi:hypothetical protein
MNITLPVSKKKVELKEVLLHGEVRDFELNVFRKIQEEGNGGDMAWCIGQKLKSDMVALLVVKELDGNPLTPEILASLEEPDAQFIITESNKAYEAVKKKSLSQ